jgi:hypothetical protein
LAVHTSSSSRANPAAALSLILGLLALAAIPAAVGVSRYGPSVPLLRGLYAGVPAAFALGLLAVLSARHARRRLLRSLGRAGGARAAAVGRALALAGLYLGCIGAIALLVYTVLRLYS